MAIISMSGPWQKRPGGPYFLRKRIPTRLLTVAGKPDIREIPLDTNDQAEAKARFPAALTRWQGMLDEWERRLNAVLVTPEKAAEIAATWAGWIAAGHKLETDGLDSEAFAALAGYPVDPAKHNASKATERLRFHTNEALRLAKIDATPDSFIVLVDAMFPVIANAYLQTELENNERRGLNVRRPLDRARKRLPKVPDIAPVESPKQTPAVPLKALGEAWQRATLNKGRSVTDTVRNFGRFVAFLGHNDATRVAPDDVLKWRDTVIASGTENKTWNTLLSAIRSVLEQAVADGKLKENPAPLRLRLKVKAGEQRLPFSDDDARTLLLEARKASRPSIRWSHWVMAFTGMRAGEVLQLTSEDIRKDGDCWFIWVNDDDDSKTVKGRRGGGRDANRAVPIHPALVAEGFVDFAQKVEAGKPLFPDKKVDANGQRGGRAWQVTGRWVHKVMPNLDKRKAANHSWRHRLQDEMRDAGVPEEVRKAILGHREGGVSGGYGVKGEALWRLSAELAKVKSPLDEN